MICGLWLKCTLSNAQNRPHNTHTHTHWKRYQKKMQCNEFPWLHPNITWYCDTVALKLSFATVRTMQSRSKWLLQHNNNNIFTQSLDTMAERHQVAWAFPWLLKHLLIPVQNLQQIPTNVLLLHYHANIGELGQQHSLLTLARPAQHLMVTLLSPSPEIKKNPVCLKVVLKGCTDLIGRVLQYGSKWPTKMWWKGTPMNVQFGSREPDLAVAENHLAL